MARLRAAGAVIIGKTNMTEFAFSGIGINPHYGTPGNPAVRARRIPGGSSSGAAVAVADGMCDIAIGSDTGGSTRIPAAFCGIVGYKPTQVAHPARRRRAAVDDARFDRADGAQRRRLRTRRRGHGGRRACADRADRARGPAPRAGEDAGLDALEPEVAMAFRARRAGLSRAGAQPARSISDRSARWRQVNAKGGFAAAEAYAWHRDLIAGGAATS